MENEEVAQFEMVPVTSSQLSQVGYDKATKRLQIVFTKGQVYVYHDVPEEVYTNLVENTASVGQYFNQHVKFSFKYDRLS